MLKHLSAAALAAALLCSAPAAADAVAGGNARGADARTAARTDARTATGITGTWRGGVYGDNGGSAGYAAKVSVVQRDGKLSGKVAYPGYCSGKWVFKGKANGWFKFREVITDDPGAPTCVTPVAVKVRRDGAKLRVVWREPSTGDTAHMLAHRV